MSDSMTLEARKARSAARLAEIREAQAAAREATLAQIEVDDAEALVEALETYDEGDITQVKTPAGSIIVKKPLAAHYRRFHDKGSAQSEDCLALIGPCRVYPSRPQMEAIFEAYPAVIQRCADAVVVLAGFRERAVEGK